MILEHRVELQGADVSFMEVWVHKCMEARDMVR